MVLFGGASGQVPPFDLQTLNTKGSLSITRPSLQDFIYTSEELDSRAADLFSAIQLGELHVEVSQEGVFALEDVRLCHEALEGRKTTGKVLLKIAS